VVEVSLDIDFDWLFTECAPADAITQRAGRVNRYRDNERDSRVFIYKASRTSERIYDPINSVPLLEATYAAFDTTVQQKGHNITERDLLDITETVYRTFDIETRELFIDATHQYDKSQQRRIGIFDSRIMEDKEDVTRHVDYETDPAIPVCFKEEVLRVPPAERRWFEVRLPRWYVAQERKRVVIEGITFCDVASDPFLEALLHGGS